MQPWKNNIVVNSANGFLLLGKSGAGKIRESSEKLILIFTALQLKGKTILSYYICSQIWT